MQNEAKKVKCTECKYLNETIYGPCCEFFMTRLIPWRAERLCSEHKPKDKEDEKRDNH